jgi:hypothetical protein
VGSQAIFRFVVWALFFNGVFLHILVRARGSIASASNSVKTFRAWWDLNWRDLGWRLAFDGVGMIAWILSPRVFGDAIHLQLPITYATAGFMGFTVDRIVDSSGFIIGFRRVDLPRVAPPDNLK